MTPSTNESRPEVPPGLSVSRRVLLAALLGVLGGVGGYTVFYAEGFSYLSKDPAACANCHIMAAPYDSWQKSSHHTVATCVDCHLPAHGLAKWISKAENGFWHSKGFTFQDFAEPIEIREVNRRLLQENCLRCHGDLVHDIVPASESDTLRCTHCHRDVGHGPRATLGGPDRGVSNEL